MKSWHQNGVSEHKKSTNYIWQESRNNQLFACFYDFLHKFPTETKKLVSPFGFLKQNGMSNCTIRLNFTLPVFKLLNSFKVAIDIIKIELLLKNDSFLTRVVSFVGANTKQEYIAFFFFKEHIPTRKLNKLSNKICFLWVGAYQTFVFEKIYISLIYETGYLKN